LQEADKVSQNKWKQKFDKVKTAGEEFDKRKEEEEKKALEVFNEDSVGPDHFKILAKLG